MACNCCLGNICGTYTAPLILPPQVCIVGIGKTQKLPRYIEDANGKTKLQPRSIVNYLNKKHFCCKGF